MKPSKTAAKRPAKRKPLETKYSILVDKLVNLRNRIDDYKKTLDEVEETNSDKAFVIGLINNLKQRDDYPLKIQLEECNKIWRKYEG